MLHSEITAVCSQIHTMCSDTHHTNLSQTHVCHNSAYTDWPGLESGATGRDTGV